MGIAIEPATSARFDDVATMLGPKNPSSSVCWCLSHRVDSRTNRELVGPARREYVRRLTERPIAPGVLAYDDGEVIELVDAGLAILSFQDPDDINIELTGPLA